MSKLLEGLNTSQQQAVTHETGPLLIIAGPGSGKTRTVVHSIAYAIENGVQPDRILAFSFTVKASEELRNRVKEIVGKEKGDLVNISTFHSFCRKVLKEDIDRLGRGYTPNFKALEEKDQRKIVKNLTRNEQQMRTKVDYIQSHRFPKAEDILNFIKKCKAREISPSDVVNQVPDSDSSEAYIKIYERYEQYLKDKGWIDYESQQLFTDELFKNVPAVKTKWQSKFDLIFVDEYQDTDPVQYRIINTLAAKHQNLRVVGDDDQGIYGFRGADIHNILNFERDYRKAKVISLGQNYRSTKKIVAASSALADFNPDRRNKELFTRKSKGETVKHLHCENANVEANTIVDFIARAIKDGRKPRDFAILCPSTKSQSPVFEEAFTNSGIPCHVIKNSSKNMFANKVFIMTIHKSKGLEFPNVFVAGVCKDLLPHYYKRDEKDWDEELRLLYVAMTRAKNWLCLSSYEKHDQYPRGRSPFLEYIPSHLLESVETLENARIPPSPEEMDVPGDSNGVTEYIEPLPEKLLGDGMTVLGIDPGNIGANTTNVGWAITQKSHDAYAVVDYDTLELAQRDAKHKQKQIEHKINELINLYRPDAVAVEKIEVGKFEDKPEATKEDWFLYVAACVAIIRSIAHQHDIECQLYTPQHVKDIATHNRDASKPEVQREVMRICNLPQIPEPHHSADAIAASLCYLRSYLNSSRFEGNKRKQECYKAGCDYLNRGQYDAAASKFQEAINIDPVYTDAHCGLGRVYIGQGDLEAAENTAKKSLTLGENNHPDSQKLLDAIERYRLGCNFVNNNQFDEAIVIFQESINLEPIFIDAHCGISRAYLGIGNLEVAKNVVEEALKLAGDYSPIQQLSYVISLYNAGLNFLNDWRYNDAINKLKEAIDKEPVFIQAHYRLGLAYFGKEALEASEQSANNILELCTDHQLALALLNDIRKAYVDKGYDALERLDLTEAEKYKNKASDIDEDCQLARQLFESIKRKYYERGIKCLEQDDLVSARESANEILRIDSNYQLAHDLLKVIKQAYYNRGLNHLDNQRYDEAITAFEETIKKYPRFIEAYCGLGQAYLGKGNLAMAGQSVRRAYELNAKCQSVLHLVADIKRKHCERGRGYLNQDNLPAAERSANEALRLDPNDPNYQFGRELLDAIKQAYYNRGLNHLDNRRYDEAIAAFKETINKYLSFTAAYCGLGQVYLEKGNLAAAGDSAEEALRLESDCQLALKILESVRRKYCELGTDYLKQDNLIAAENAAEEARKLARRLGNGHQLVRNLLGVIKQAYYERACNHLGNQQYNEAIATFKEVVDRYPNFIEAHCGLAQTYLEKGDDLVAAEEPVKQARRIDPDYPLVHTLWADIKQAYDNRSIALIEVGEYIKAIDLLLKLYSIDPNNKDVCTNLADVYCLIEDDANAASWYQKVADIDPNDKIAYIELGNAYYNMGEYEKAVDSFQEASELDPNCERVLNYWKRADFKLQKDRKMKSDRMIRIPGDKYIDAFYIDIYLVTNAQYKVFVDQNPEWHKDHVSGCYDYLKDWTRYLKDWNGSNYPPGKANHPVVDVNWYAAMAYALWLGKRLPTESEWGKAASGYGSTTKLVGNYLPDSIGHVWEWCFNEYDSNSDGSSWCLNPVGVDEIDEIVTSFRNIKTSRVVRRLDVINQRRGNRPSFTDFRYGFRCVSSGND